jgi:hypothetical protein
MLLTSVPQCPPTRHLPAGDSVVSLGTSVRYGPAAMAADPRSASSEQDWRLQAELDAAGRRGVLEDLVGSLRSPNVVKEIEATVPHDVVVTHDGNLLFAYAADEATLKATRRAIEDTLKRDGITGRIRLSHWDSELDDWRQTEPPGTTQDKRVQDLVDREAETMETRTLVASAGKLIRAEFEQSLLEWANELGLQCKVIEHPHLLTAQVGFTVTGPKRKLDEFSQGLKAEERVTIRTETAVMLSPL